MVHQPDIFALTSRPDKALFYQRDDPNDVRLGAIMSVDPSAYDAARVILLGCPQDEGVRRNGGRPGAAEAPDAIRRCLYRLSSGNLGSLPMFDLGNTIPQDSLEATHALHQQVVERLLRDGKRLIVLGGGNDIAYPDVAGLAAVFGHPLTFNIDAHFDVRADVPRNSGTPYRQLLDEGLLAPDRFYELGSQPYANSPVYQRYLAALGVQVVSLDTLRRHGAAGVVDAILARDDAAAIFWGLDMDVVRAADAPGVSAPNPLGMSGEEFCQLAAGAGADPRTQIVELSEVNPAYDLDGRTCRLAAVAIWSVLAAIAGSLHQLGGATESVIP